MASIIATVVAVSGSVQARAADGSLRLLKAGDALYEGETVVTGAGARVELALADGELFSVVENQSVALSGEMVETARADAPAAAVADASVAEVLQALAEGADLNELLEDPAAGLSGGSGGEGNDFVRLLRIVENVDPLAFAFPNEAANLIEEIEGGTADEGTEEAVPPTTEPPTTEPPTTEPPTTEPPTTEPPTTEPPNNGPEAEGDEYDIVEGTTAELGSLLDNDTDLDGDPIQVSAVRVNGTEYIVSEGTSVTFTTPLGGTVTLQPDGTFSYVAPILDHDDEVPNHDTFEYRVTDGTDESSWTTVKVNVTDTDVDAIDDHQFVAQGTTVTGNVLGNDTGNDQPLRVDQVSFQGETKQIAEGGEVSFDTPNGLLVIRSDGSYSYTSQMQPPVSYKDPNLNMWVAENGVVGLYGFRDNPDGSDWTFDIDKLTTAASQDVGFKGGGGSGKAGVGVMLLQSSAVDHDEHLVIALQGEADSVLVSLGQFNAAQSEQGFWTAYDLEGNVVGSGSLGGGVNDNGGVYSVLIDPPDSFSYLNLSFESGSTSNAGFVVSDIDVNYAPDVFEYVAIDIDGSTDSATLTLTPYGEVITTLAARVLEDDGALSGSGAGDDVLYGGLGADVFEWHLGDQGSADDPARDVIKDFSLAEGDALDLRDLLQDESAGTLDSYLHFEFDPDSGDTTVMVSSTGAFGEGGYDAADQVIVVENVDLTSGLGSDQLIIQDLINKGKLITD